MSCQVCRRDDEPLIVMMQAWCRWRWLCRWCAELAVLRHTLGLSMTEPEITAAGVAL